MLAGNQLYLMRPGEVWALNNSSLHAVWNAHPTMSRTHMICDFTITPALQDLLLRSERDLGRDDANVMSHWSTNASA
jgi:hypothetical protein